MPQLDSDSFTYSDGALATVSGGKWSNLSGKGNLTVGGNLIDNPGGVESAAVITTWSGSTTAQYSQVTYIGAGEGGPSILSNDSDDFICVDFVPGDAAYVFECVNGTLNALGDPLTLGDTIDTGDVFYIEIQGTTITVKQNGVTLGTRTASGTITSGKPGIFNYAGQFDNWAAGDFGGGAAPVRRSTRAFLGAGR